ncbi:helix-turn-helix domain-containing protein, partial [candidate division KSB1 bacterium]|nr:helix-turn-helix domain-containing protein [candidate division KSB1 bacterium]
KEKIVKKILQSSVFKDSKKTQELLQYLVKASEKKETVKEVTIAADLFGKESSYDPHDDPSIRVYVSNLRKKLEYYYLTDGKKDDIRIEIPKGHYHVEFVPADNKQKKFTITYKHLSYFFFIPSILILVILLFIQKKSVENSGPVNKEYMVDHPVWAELLNDRKNPTLIVLGDYFFLFEIKPGMREGYFVRDPMINSAEEFRRTVRMEPQLLERFSICNFTYLGPATAESLLLLLPVLSLSPNKTFIKLASELKWDEMNRNNIIYVGPLKTLYELNKLFSNLPFRYQISPPQLFLINNHADTTAKFRAMREERTTYKKDFGIILKHKGPENNIVLLLTGFDELGINEAIKYSTDANFRNRLENQVTQLENKTIDYFFTFIEVEGVERTSFKSAVKHFQPLTMKN